MPSLHSDKVEVEAPPRGELDGLLSGYLRRKRKEQVLPLLRRASRILDFGCGLFVWEGVVAEFQYYLGLDIEPEIIEYNRRHFPGHDFDLIDMGRLDFEELPGDFDLVVMLASIEHIRNPERILAALKEKLVPDGKVVLTTPAPWSEIILEAGAVVKIFASDKHQHEDLLGKKDLGELAVEAGFQMTHYARFLFFQNQLAVFERLLA